MNGSTTYPFNLKSSLLEFMFILSECVPTLQNNDEDES